MSILGDLPKHNAEIYRTMLQKFFGTDIENWAFYMQEINKENSDNSD